MLSLRHNTVMIGMLSAFYASAGLPVADAPGTVHFGFGHGSERNVTYLNPIVPVRTWLPGGFLDFRYIEPSDTSREFNLGFGRRGFVAQNRALLGAYLFYDRRRSVHDNSFEQLTVGMDYLSAHLDVRGNVYLPRNKSVQIGLGAPYLGPNGIMRDALYEEAQSGFDVEVGTPVPLLSRLIETRAYLGWAEFHGDRSPDSQGVTARIELHPNQNLRLAASFRDDAGYGSSSFVELRLSLPMSRHLWRDLQRSLKIDAGTSRSLLQRRYEPPVRDIDIVTRAVPEPNLIQPLVYVDNRYAGAVETGSLSAPYTRIQPALDAAGESEWVYVSGGGADYTERLNLSAGQTLLGSGYRYLGIGGDVRPVIDGGQAGNVITLATNTRVMGVEVRNSGADHSGFHIQDADTVQLTQNRARDNGHGISVISTGAVAMRDIVLHGNDLHNNSHAGVRIVNQGDVEQAVTLSGNRIYTNGYFGIEARTEAGGQRLRLEDTTLTGNAIGGIWAQRLNGVQTVDLGGGSLGAQGGNRLFGNGAYDIANDSGAMLSADSNWWGVSGFDPGRQTFGPGGTLSTENVLQTDPDPESFSAALHAAPLLYVDNAAAGMLQDGSFANPYTSIVAALAQTTVERPIVYVAEGAVAYTADMPLRSGDILWGSGYRDLGLGGGTHPVIEAGGVLVDGIENTTIQGLKFSNPSTAAIQVINSDNVTIRHNIMDSTISRMAAVQARINDGEAHQGLYVYDNQQVWNAFGVQLNVGTDSSLTDVVLRGNDIENSLFGLYVINVGRDVDMRIEHTTLAPWFAGAWLSQNGSSANTVVDFGGGSLGSVGQNRFLSGSGYMIGGLSAVQTTARFNWWGQATGPTPGQANSSVDTRDWLTSDPAP